MERAEQQEKNFLGIGRRQSNAGIRKVCLFGQGSPCCQRQLDLLCSLQTLLSSAACPMAGRAICDMSGSSVR